MSTKLEFITKVPFIALANPDLKRIMVHKVGCPMLYWNSSPRHPKFADDDKRYIHDATPERCINEGVRTGFKICFCGICDAIGAI